MHELISPAFNFLVLVVVLFVFLRKPVVQALALRHEQIKKQLQEADEIKKSAQNKFDEYSLRLNQLDSEADAIIKQSKQDAEKIKNTIIEEAKRTSEKMLKDAESNVQNLISTYTQNIKNETLDEAFLLAEKLIKDGWSVDDQKKFVNDYVGKV